MSSEPTDSTLSDRGSGEGVRAPDGETARDWKLAVMFAYGHLWHVNNEPAAPIALYEPERAAYQARRYLRDLLTTQERGEAINQVGFLIGRYEALSEAVCAEPAPTTASAPANSATDASQAELREAFLRHADAETRAAAPPALESDRLDAERYRKLRAQHWNDGKLCVVRTETVREPRFLGVDCPYGERLDELVDGLIKD